MTMKKWPTEPPTRAYGPRLLWAWRNMTGTTQGALAELIHTRQPRIAKYERGGVVPSIVMALAIERVTKIPVAAWDASTRITLPGWVKAAKGKPCHACGRPWDMFK